VVAVDPELPDGEGPDWFSIVFSALKMILEELGYVFRVEKSLSFNSFSLKQIAKQFL